MLQEVLEVLHLDQVQMELQELEDLVVVEELLKYTGVVQRGANGGSGEVKYRFLRVQ
jgi:hypothetical protein